MFGIDIPFVSRPDLSASQVFALRVAPGLLVGLWFVLWIALQQKKADSNNTDIRLHPWIDTYLITLLAGIIGARVLYVLFHTGYFKDYPLESFQLWYGALYWQGAFIGGGLAVWWMCRQKQIALSAFLDALALAIPVGFMAVWWGRRSAGCGIGKPVTDINNYPVWQVSYQISPWGDILPRYELQMLAIGLGAVMLLIAGGLTLRNALPGKRFSLILIFIGLAMMWLNRWQDDRLYREFFGIHFDFLFNLLLIITGLATWLINPVKNRL